jgi:hypothetical protein
MSAMTVPEPIARASYVSLTTFRKDGTPVVTPVWAVVDGDDLFIVSDADAGKVKRIRRDGRVTVVACTIRGQVAPDAVPVEGTARILDDAATQAGRSLIAKKYAMARIGYFFAKLLRLRRKPVTGIAVSF